MKGFFQLIIAVFATAIVQAQVYVPGDHNGWALDGTSQATLKTNLGATSHYGFTLQPTVGQGFKVVNGAWGTDWGGGYWITGYDQRWTPGWQGGNAQWQGGPNTYVHVSIENPGAYGGTNIPLGIMTLSAAPVTVTGSAVSLPAGTGAQIVNITTSGSPSAQEKIYVRYTTDGWATDNFVLATGLGTTWAATIPGQSGGTTVEYYVLTTTLTWSSGNDLDNYTDLMTINYDVNGGSNWSYTVNGNHVSITSGPWNSASTWLPGTVPTSTSNVEIATGTTVSCTGGDANNLDVAGTLNHTSGTITIHSGGDMADGFGAGVYNATGGSSATVYFNAGGTFNGYFTFNNLWLGGGGLMAGPASVSNEFALRSGGFVTTAPTYLSGCTLNYWTGGAYGVSNEWNTGAGAIPDNVKVTNTTLDLSGGANLQIQSLIIESGGTVNMSTNFGEDLVLYANLTVNGTLNDNNRAIVFGGINQQITASGTLQLSYPVIASTGTVTIASGSSNIEVSKIIELESGTLATNGKLVLKSDASGTAVLDDFSGSNSGTISGNVVSQRYIPGSGFHYIAPQMTGATTATFSGIGWSGPNGAAIIPDPACITTAIDPASPYGTALEWSESGPFPTNCFQEGWIVKSAGAFTSGKGFAASLNASTISQTGTPHTGTVTYGGLQNNPNGTTYGGGWNMIGNPYCSPVAWTPTAMTNIAAFGQRWESSGTYAGTYSAIPPGTIIASGQAIFAHVTSTPGAAVFTDAQRTLDLNPAFYRLPARSGELEIVVKGDELADRTVIRLSDNAYNGFDYEEDAQKLIGDPSRPTLYTLVDGDMVSYNSVSAYNLPEFIDLVFTTGTSGEFNLNFNGLKELPVSGKVYLMDRMTGVLLDLSKQDSYTFQSSPEDSGHRFRLVFGNEEESIQQEQTFIANAENGLLKVFGLSGQNRVRVLDVSGKTLIDEVSNIAGLATFDVNFLSSGVYLVNVDGIGTEKFIIK